MQKLTQSRLKELLDYNPNTGIFIWKVAVPRKIKAGAVAGNIRSDGYVRIQVDGKRFRAHRLAMLYMDGYLPEHGVDHRDGDRSNNRWNNLRHATQSCNAQNQQVQTNNMSGFPGVCWVSSAGKWQSGIMVNWKYFYIGRYENKLDAALARYTAEVQCPHWNCNHRSEIVKAIRRVWPEFIATI